MVNIVDKIDEFELLYKNFDYMRNTTTQFNDEQLVEFVKKVLLDLIVIEKRKQVEKNLKAYLELT